MIGRGKIIWSIKALAAAQETPWQKCLGGNENEKPMRTDLCW